MKYFDGDFLEARYMSADRSVIQAYFKQGDLTSVVNITADMNNRLYTDLLKITTVEDIESSTLENNNQISEQLIILAKKEASRQGITDQTLSQALDIIFNFDNTKHSDFLFQLKINCFEMPEVRSSDKNDLKANLRSAIDPIEVLLITKQILSPTT